MKIKFRTWYKAIPPKPIKLQIPGWSGEHRQHCNGASPQPWHCTPFIEASTYGLELLYPFDTETKIINDGNNIIFQGDFSKECVWSENSTPPFVSFSKDHYGFTSSLDIQSPEKYVVRIEPHPKFFTDATGTVPIAVPGHIHPWWARIFFIVFKSPLKGQMHIFRKGEPYAQILIIPQKSNYKIEEMTDEEKKQRSETENKISRCSEKIAKHNWTDNKGQKFNDKYKTLLSIANKDGEKAVQKHVDTIAKEEMIEFQQLRKAKLVGKYVKKNKKF